MPRILRMAVPHSFQTGSAAREAVFRMTGGKTKGKVAKMSKGALSRYCSGTFLSPISDTSRVVSSVAVRGAPAFIPVSMTRHVQGSRTLQRQLHSENLFLHKRAYRDKSPRCLSTCFIPFISPLRPLLWVMVAASGRRVLQCFLKQSFWIRERHARYIPHD